MLNLFLRTVAPVTGTVTERIDTLADALRFSGHLPAFSVEWGAGRTRFVPLLSEQTRQWAKTSAEWVQGFVEASQFDSSALPAALTGGYPRRDNWAWLREVSEGLDSFYGAFAALEFACFLDPKMRADLSPALGLGPAVGALDAGPAGHLPAANQVARDALLESGLHATLLPARLCSCGVWPLASWAFEGKVYCNACLAVG